MSIKKYISQFEKVIPLKTCSNLIRYANSLSFEKAKIGLNTLNEKIRKVNTYSLTPHTGTMSDCHWARFLNFKIVEIMNLYLDLQNLKEFETIPFLKQCDLLKYEEYGHYNYHVDASVNFHRILSAILFLNNDYEGGELLFKDMNDEEIKINPIPGSLVIWPSNFLFPHKVNPLKFGKRFTVVAWG